VHGKLCLGYLEKESDDLAKAEKARVKKFMPGFLKRYKKAKEERQKK